MSSQASQQKWFNLAGLSPRELIRKTWKEARDDAVMNRAAELAFWFLLGFFPMLLFVLEISSMMASGSQSAILSYLHSMLPSNAAELVGGVLNQTRSSARAWVPLLLALWSASSASNELIETLNAIYDLQESRTIGMRRLIALALALGMGVMIIAALAVLIYGGSVLRQINAGPTAVFLWNVGQYPAAICLLVLSLLLVYRYAPNVEEQKWKWLLPGSIVASATWLLISFVFRVYVNHFSDFGLLYGSLGTLVILMFWFYLSGIAILVGGEINAIIESAAAQHHVAGAKGKGQRRISS